MRKLLLATAVGLGLLRPAPAPRVGGAAWDLAVDHRQVEVIGRGDPEHPSNFHLLAPHDTAEECRSLPNSIGNRAFRTGEVNLDSTDLEFPTDAATGCEQEIGIRFERVYIPQLEPPQSWMGFDMSAGTQLIEAKLVFDVRFSQPTPNARPQHPRNARARDTPSAVTLGRGDADSPC